MNTKKMEEKTLDSISSDISVVDVYDLASDIGKECEKIIDCYGAEAVTALMPKVVNALEMLETLANQNENENTNMQMLSDRVASLESEKIERAVYREKLQRVGFFVFIIKKMFMTKLIHCVQKVVSFCFRETKTEYIQKIEIDWEILCDFLFV